MEKQNDRPCWLPTTVKPQLRSRRKITIIVYRFAEAHHVTYDCKTDKIINRSMDVAGELTDFKLWCFAPRTILDVR